MFAAGIRSELEPGVPDGMKCDAHGNVWVTAPGGVWVYAPGGELIGKVRVPETRRPTCLGRRGFPHAVRDRDALGLHGDDQGRPAQRALHAARARIRGGGRARSDARPLADGAASRAPDRGRQPVGRSPTALDLDPRRCALIIQDMQNDVVMEGGAFAVVRLARPCRQQNVVENVRRLAEACRARGVMVIHVWFVVEPGAPGMTLNAPLFEGVVDNKALVRGTWGAAPVPGLEPQPGDFVVEKMRMSAWEGTRLETMLRARRARRDHQHRRLDQHVGRAHRAHRRRQGLLRRPAGGLLLDHERRLAQRLDQLRAAERRGRHHDRRGDRRAGVTARNPGVRPAAPAQRARSITKQDATIDFVGTSAAWV